MLIYCVGADDEATQSDPDFNNKSDEESEISFDEDARSSTDGSVRPRRPITESFEPVIEEEAPAPALDPAPEALDSKLIEEATPCFAWDPAPEAPDSKFVSLGWGSSKKSKKKSRVSAARVAFEED